MSDFDVIVIGAGIAGLKAASDLSKVGLKCVILEGRERVGGRVWTQEGVGDLGASWIHGHVGNPIHAIAKEKGLSLYRFDYEEAQLYGLKERGEVKDRVADKMEEEFEKAMKLVSKKAKKLRSNGDFTTTLRQVLEEVKTEIRLTPEDEPFFETFVATEIVHEFAADPDCLSAANYDEGEDLKGEDFLFPDSHGYSAIVTSIADQLLSSCQIILNAAVCQIVCHEGSNSASVNVEDGRSFTSKAIVLTVPLGVLKHSICGSHPSITFNPPLPQQIVSSVEALGCAVLNKHILIFEGHDATQAFNRIKDYDVLNFYDASHPKAIPFPEAVNLAKATHGAKLGLIVFTAGSEAYKISAIGDDNAVKDLIMHQLRLTALGSKLPDPVRFMRTHWERDPYARCSYSCLAPGCSENTREVLTHALYGGRLFLAGEHTCVDYPSTVQGAFLSGERVAKQVSKLLHH